ncbi:LGFP repeat-containing protein [Arthrobacter sp. PM3]|uniref:LGFP repeat-containing protein n=1 Tax=Arthrobacter sp. PM3 TaxID=2017685 RepID=UPI001ABF45B0|nr:hypothetical protein [Arthrobacter sp. PM3]
MALAVPILLGGFAIPADAAVLPAPPSSANGKTPSQIDKTFASVRAKHPFLGAASGSVIWYSMGAVKTYKGGAIVWSIWFGTKIITSAGMRDAYLRLGGPDGIGLPTSAETKLKGGTIQSFTIGDLYWSPKGGAHMVASEIPWKGLGGVKGRLGYPTSDKINNGANRWFQKFEGGMIYTDWFARSPYKIVYKK